MPCGYSQFQGRCSSQDIPSTKLYPGNVLAVKIVLRVLSYPGYSLVVTFVTWVLFGSGNMVGLLHHNSDQSDKVDGIKECKI